MKKKSLPPQFIKKAEAAEAKKPNFKDMPEKSAKDAAEDYASGQKMAAAAEAAKKK
jgi:hypothetical protein